jgi:uracil-DNA glycosylase family 4
MGSPGAAEFVPHTDDLTVLADASQSCKGCDRTATPLKRCSERAPAGRLLDKALVAAGIDRKSVYVTNAVKHFKFEERGVRRIHKTPSRTEVVSCQPWLLNELSAVRPDVVVLLGATAAKSLMGSSFRLTAHRGEVLRLPTDDKKVDIDIDPQVVATVHPSAILRGPPDDRDKAFDALVADLRVVAGLS